jgi:DNA repair protein RadC
MQYNVEELRATYGDAQILYAAAQILHATAIGSDYLNSPQQARDYIEAKIAAEAREHFMVVFLNSQHRVISAEVMFSGTLNQTSVYPREVVRRALQRNAAAVLFAHNHPSGIPEPSRADEYLTQALKQALALVDVRVLDHLVVARGASTISFAERGLL